MTRTTDAGARFSRRESLRYLAVGGWNTLFGYGLFVVLHQLLRHRIQYIVILTIAHIISTINAFILYRYLVFQVRGTVMRDFARFSLVYVAAYVANVVLLPLLVEVGGMNVLLAQALVVAGTVVASFFAHKFFSFKRPETP